MENKPMQIAIFTEGTVLMHESAIGHNCDEIVKQVINKNPSVRNYANYASIANAVGKIQNWVNQGIQIVYITSRKKQQEIDEIQNVFNQNNSPKGLLEYRKANEKYKDVVERIMPDILIENDCESIGGQKEMTITFVKPRVKQKIKSIVVKEFQGIDHLPDSINSL